MPALPCSPPSDTCSLTGESEAKRQQILDGARAVFAQHGFEGASMSAIAREANVSKGTLYNYFTCKAELFEAFVEQNCREKLPTALEPIKRNQPVRETLTAIAQAIINLTTLPESLMLYRIIISEAPHFPKLTDVFWKNGPKIAIETLAEWLSAQTRQGLLQVEDPVFAAELFFTMCQTRITHKKRFNMVIENEEAERQKVIHTVVDVFLSVHEKNSQPARV
ncbi:TetR/AcrR family transcriptional regulator [Acetobacter thailandicus]|uniref:TetR/AcrR family transcriptional regulator n=1 Tax=Acetobacter thailandicus TaxID=1502842 RepID=A0ABT3QEF7_9PROT|nr:TetR/AcrR family transcriptional regulator [Acetobacter thailandicus]MCX2563673.1 TetR/AcrR family transcriptional regulator [Acetobacter thailandicus]NHN94423.1 TetR family transcriptional regulator [Acetobacter thailandicus]